MQNFPLVYQPGLDCTWDKAPGAIRRMYSFAPLNDGNYGSMAYDNGSVITGADVVSAFIVTPANGSRRLLVFRKTNIDEYSNAAVRTNQATGLTTTNDWDVAQFGDATIAVSLQNATQVSTGSTFAALAGAPKAKCIAVNSGFVMLANYNDGTAYADGYATCALRNYTDWVASPITQAVRGRLYETPGAITGLAPYKEQFVAWKDSSMILGQYVGPDDILNWRVVSYRVGCVSKHAWAELDGKLYFVHTSGIYEFDGSTLRNVGLPVWRLAVYYMGRGDNGPVDWPVDSPTWTSDGVDAITASADDIEGIVWFSFTGFSSFGRYQLKLGYNPRTGQWGHGAPTLTTATFADSPARLVRATSADLVAFLPTPFKLRLYSIWNATAGSTLRGITYPDDLTHFAAIDTGRFGSNDQSTNITRAALRLALGSDVAPAFNAATCYVAHLPHQPMYDLAGGAGGQSNLESPVPMSYSASLDELQFAANSRWKRLHLEFTPGQTLVVAGVGVDGLPTRR